MTATSKGKILIFIGNDYEDMELQYPKYRLIEAGYEVVIAGLDPAGTVYHGKYHYPQISNACVDHLHAEDFIGLVIPGGWMPDKLRRHEAVLRLTREIHAAGKMVASICHGPWIDISAGIVKGATYTCTPGIKDDVNNAGGTWVDRPLVIDANHVTSRRPDDLPEFAKGMLQVLEGSPKATTA